MYRHNKVIVSNVKADIYEKIEILNSILINSWRSVMLGKI